MTLLIATAILSCVFMCALVCSKTLARTVPQNYIILLLFTLCESYTVAVAVAGNPFDKVIIALLMTISVTVGLTVYAFCTTTDFTMMGGSLFIIGFALLGFGIVSVLFHSPVMYMVYNIFCVILYGFYLVYDT